MRNYSSRRSISIRALCGYFKCFVHRQKIATRSRSRTLFEIETRVFHNKARKKCQCRERDRRNRHRSSFGQAPKQRNDTSERWQTRYKCEFLKEYRIAVKIFQINSLHSCHSYVSIFFLIIWLNSVVSKLEILLYTRIP